MHGNVVTVFVITTRRYFWVRIGTETTPSERVVSVLGEKLSRIDSWCERLSPILRLVQIPPHSQPRTCLAEARPLKGIRPVSPSHVDRFSPRVQTQKPKVSGCKSGQGRKGRRTGRGPGGQFSLNRFAVSCPRLLGRGGRGRKRMGYTYERRHKQPPGQGLRLTFQFGRGTGLKC